MLRRLLLAGLVVMTPHAAAAQSRSVVHITVTIAGSDGTVTPVPRYALLISDTPPSAAPRRVLTSLEGTVDVRLDPGTYTVESDRPVAVDGAAYRWTVMVDVAEGKDARLSLTTDNAEVVPVTDDAASTSAPIDADPSSLLARWQDSLVAVWTATNRGSGFIAGPDGLVAADQQVVGNATAVEVQLSPAVKVAGSVVVSDPVRGVALIRVNPAAVASGKILPLGCDAPAETLTVDQEIVALEAPLLRRRSSSTGAIEVLLPNVIETDLRASTGGSGGPVFAPSGRLIGLTTLVPEHDGRRPDRTRIVRVNRVCDLIASEGERIAATSPPPASQLPVESARPAPGLPAAAGQPARTGRMSDYRASGADFEVMFVTPRQLLSRPDPSRQNDLMEQLLSDFGNWSAYVDQAPPVLLIRVTPKLVEGFWAKVARGAASTFGASMPALKHLKADFATMRILCGDADVVPVHPFRVEHRVSDTDTLVEGLYAVDPGALSPGCATVTLQMYSEKDSAKADVLVVDPKLIQRIWDDLEPWRGKSTFPSSSP